MTKAQLKEKFERWTTLSRKRQKIETDRRNQLETLLETYEKKAEPINAEANRQLDVFMDELLTLESEIGAEMLASVKPDGKIDIPQLDNKFGLAQVITDKKRHIDPAAFLRAVPPARRHEPAFFKCLSILITPSEKFLDTATMSRLARPKLTYSAQLTLKESD